MSTKKSIIIQLIGGLGNQLFQICFGLRMARQTGFNLKFDTSSYCKDPFGRSSFLQVILPNAEEITITQEIKKKLYIINEATSSRLEPWFLGSKANVPNEIEYIYFTGYWQDSRYVLNNETDLIFERLSSLFKSKINNEILEKLSSKKSLAVHIRRHDYKHHGLVLLDYYFASIRSIIDNFGDHDIFLFSDEPNFVKFVFNQRKIKYNFINTKSDLFDLYVMCLANKHIIANSTYSWWGARLNNSSLTIAPNSWSLMHTPSKYLLPNEWIKVDNVLEANAFPIEEELMKIINKEII